MSPNSIREPPNSQSQEYMSPSKNQSPESSMHTPPNFSGLEELNDFEPFEFIPNSLQYFYPKPLQK